MDKKKKDLFNKLLIIYIIIQPLLDALAGISANSNFINFKINIIVRGLFLVFVGIYLLFMSKNKYQKFNLIYLLITFIYFGLYAWTTYMSKQHDLFMFEMRQCLLYFYFPITLLAIFNMREDKVIKLEDKYLVISLIIYLSLIIIPNIFGLSFRAYDNGVGQLGLFYSANSISAILSMLLPCAIIYFRNNIKLLILFLVFFILCIISLGTKTVILSLLIVLFINFIYYIRNSKKKLDNKKKIIIIISSFVALVGLVFIVPKTAVYKNIETRIKFLEIKNVNDVLDNFDALVLSRRLKYLKDVNKVYNKASLPQKVIGIGYLNGSGKAIEMDYFDIFYCNGILGFLIYFTPLIYILMKYKKKKKNFISINRFSSLLIIFLTSFLTGHVLIEPNAAFYVAILIIMFTESYD